MKFPKNKRVMKKEVLTRLLWSTSVFLVRGQAGRGAQFEQDVYPHTLFF
jgi:hypothetical protein